MTDKYYRIILDSTQAEKGAKRFDSAMRGAGKSGDKLSGSLAGVKKSTAGLTTQVNRLASAVSAALVTRQIVEYADAWKSTQNQLKQVTSTQAQLTQSTKNLFEVAQETRSSFESTVELYSKMSRATQEMNLSSGDLAGVTKTINQLFASSGASAQEASNAIRQLAQGLASGALRGDEFNSVSEQAPGIMRAIAAETGKSIGQLRKFAGEGGITSKLLIKSLQNYKKEAEDTFKKTDQTFGQSVVKARNNAIAFVGATTEITDAVSIMGEGIVLASENLDTIKDVFIIFAGVMGARVAGSIATATTAVIANTVAQVTATTVTGGYSFAMGVQAKRATASAVALNVMSIAAKKASLAMALVGGPVGLAIIAASALVYFATKADDAKKPTALLAGEVDILTQSYRDLEEEARKAEIVRINTEIEIATKKITEATNKLTESQSKSAKVMFAIRNSYFGIGSAFLKDITDAGKIKPVLKDLNIELDNLIKKQSALQTASIPLPDTEDPDEIQIIETDFTLKALQNETAQMAAELELRKTIQTEYSQAVFDARVGSFEREKAALDQYLAEERGSKDLQLQADLADIQLRREKIQEDQEFEFEAKGLYLTELNEQEILLTEEKQQFLTELETEGAEARKLIAEAEANFKLNLVQSSLSDIAGALLQGGKKSFEIGKKVSIAAAGVEGAQSTVSAWRSGMETPGPYAPLFAAAYAGASLLKTNAQINRIKSMSYSGGGSGGGGGGGSLPSVGGASGGSLSQSSIPTTANQTQQQRTVIDLRGATQDDLIRIDTLAEALEATNVAVAINGSLREASRIGAIV